MLVSIGCLSNFHEEENKKEHNLAVEHTPANLLVGSCHELFHIVVNFDHLSVGFIDVVSQTI